MKRCILHLPGVADAATRQRHKRLKDALTASGRLSSPSRNVRIPGGHMFHPVRLRLPSCRSPRRAGLVFEKTPGKSQGSECFHPWAQAPDNQPPPPLWLGVTKQSDLSLCSRTFDWKYKSVYLQNQVSHVRAPPPPSS